jgi:hypothetical protein
MKAVVDTNVPVVANGRNTHLSASCRLMCVEVLELLRKRGRVFIDDQGIILAEYSANLNFCGQPGVGDAFYRYLFHNQFLKKRVARIAVKPRNPDTGHFEEFPDDAALGRFDRSDRIFVAVCMASKMRPEIINAADSDWVFFEEPLRQHGVRVKHLCKSELKGKRKPKPTPKGIKQSRRGGRR